LRARDLKQHLSGSLDAAAAQPLETVSAAAAGGGPWERVKALMQLSSIAGSAADNFEALQNAEAAAKDLVGLGYRDPGECGADAAMDSWIRTACAGLKGIPLLRQVSQTGAWFDGILGARFAVLVRKEPAPANVLQALQVEVQKLNARMHQEAALADAEVRREFERCFPPPPGKQPEAQPSSGSDFESLMDRMRAVDAALAQIQETCNQRAAARQNMDDLLAAVGKLEAEADTLNSPEYEAKTRLARAYILLQLGRGADLGPVAREARSRLLAGRPASLSSFAQSHQRYLYLDSLKREAMGCMMTGDFEGSLKICEATVRDFETERYRVNSEYRQSALLSYVSEFYKWAVFSAFKLKRWDNMLEAIDLIKARSAIRSRLIPDAPERLNSDLLREFDAVSAGLEREPKNENFKTRRRQLWDLLSIADAQNGAAGEIPALSVAAVQEALEEDEALIGYFWLSGTVILAVAADRERFQAERIVLKPEEADGIREFVSFVQALKTSHNMDRAVAKLGAILLPDFLRDFIKPKKRIVFSPHHSLHLFPFHAARWGAEGFVGTEFAVRYAPNFCAVLLPWIRRTEDRMLAIGIGKFTDPAVQPLENVEDDAAAVAGFYRASGSEVETLLGKDATRERIEALRNQGALQQFRCVHLGTHGLSVFETPEQPLESRLLVQNGALDAMDIANLRLSAELVMLSACHSGQRAIELRDLGEAPGDDIFGLQSALFRSGVRSIVGTLWLVETKSSSPVTRAFHRHYAEGKPAEVALQLSVREYLATAPARCSGVYYWAPYFISSIGSSGKAQTGKGEAWQN
jgi:CHAT domain-containing protein